MIVPSGRSIDPRLCPTAQPPSPDRPSFLGDPVLGVQEQARALQMGLEAAQPHPRSDRPGREVCSWRPVGRECEGESSRTNPVFPDRARPPHDRQRSPIGRQPSKCRTQHGAEDRGGQAAIQGQRAQARPVRLGGRRRGRPARPAAGLRLVRRPQAPERVPVVAGRRGRHPQPADRPLRADGAAGPRRQGDAGRTLLGGRPAARRGPARRAAPEAAGRGGRGASADPPGVRVADDPVGDAGPHRRREGGLDAGSGPAGVRPAGHPGRVPRGEQAGRLARPRRPADRVHRRPGRRRPPRDRRLEGASGAWSRGWTR